jgi:site-specific recombinase XerC
MTTSTTLLPFQPDAMTPAQLAAVSYLARYSGHTHALYAYQLRRWFGWCEANGLDALTGVQRAHVELYIRHLRDCGLRDSSICTMLHGVRGFCEPGTPSWATPHHAARSGTQTGIEPHPQAGGPPNRRASRRAPGPSLA